MRCRRLCCEKGWPALGCPCWDDSLVRVTISRLQSERGGCFTLTSRCDPRWPTRAAPLGHMLGQWHTDTCVVFSVIREACAKLIVFDILSKFGSV